MSHLTPRQREILLLMAAGLSNQEIAERLCIERSTLQAHRKNLYRETDTHDMADLIAWGRRWLHKEYLEIERLLHPEDDDGSRDLPRSG